MKMSVSNAINLRAALKNCDGYQALVKRGDSQESAFCLYELGFAARWAIANNIKSLEEVYSTFIKHRDEAIKSIAKNGTAINPEEEPEGFGVFRAKEAEMLESEIEVDVQKIKKSDIENSNLPVSLLAALMQIIE
jgi:hypothetical protein